MPGNMGNLMKQAQRMQRQLEEKQEELKNKTWTATAGGGVVKVTVSGEKKVSSIEIDPEVVDPDDIETLQDLVMAAVNEAYTAMETEQNEAMSSLTGGFSGLPF